LYAGSGSPVAEAEIFRTEHDCGELRYINHSELQAEVHFCQQ
jgi:hypothetical protein